MEVLCTSFHIAARDATDVHTLRYLLVDGLDLKVVSNYTKRGLLRSGGGAALSGRIGFVSPGLHAQEPKKSSSCRSNLLLSSVLLCFIH